MSNLPSILNLGLLANTLEPEGDLTVSFFRTEADAQRETRAWLASKWKDQPLTLLTVDVTGLRLTETFPYELITTSSDPVSFTRVLSHRPFLPDSIESVLNPIQMAQAIQTEVFEGLAFWDRYGDGAHHVGARARSVTPEALVNRFPLFAPEFLEFQVTFVVSVGTKIVALAGCAPDLRMPGRLGLSYVTVNTDYRGRGYGSMLCKAITEYMRLNEFKTLDCSGYSELGLERLRPVLLRVTKDAWIRMKDKNSVEYPSSGAVRSRRRP